MLLPFSVESSREWENCRERPWCVISLVAACVLVHVLLWRLPPERILDVCYRFGVVKFGFQPWTVVTCTFLHGGWMHLIGNMLFLWVYGVSVEKLLGRTRFLVIYFGGGALSIALHLWTISPLVADVPTIGASGAISAVLGTFLVMLPGSRIRCALVLFLRPIILNLPAWLVLGMWFIGQLYFSIDPLAGTGNVAFWAHVGGFCGGAVIGTLCDIFMRRRQAQLARAWQEPLQRAWQHLSENRIEDARQAYREFRRHTCFPGPEYDPVLAAVLAEHDNSQDGLLARLGRGFRRALDGQDMAGVTTIYLAMLRQCNFDEIAPDVHRLAGNAAITCNQPWIGLRAYCCALQTGLLEGGDDILKRAEAAARHKLADTALADRIAAIRF